MKKGTESENMIKWKCSQCRYYIEAPKPPEICPSCQTKCSFTNSTCYTPECGGEKNIDPRLFDNQKEASITKKKYNSDSEKGQAK